MFPFEQLVNDIIATITGPLSFRFILQPAIAILLAIRDGRLDAKLKKAPFLFDIISNPTHRQVKIKSTLRSIFAPIVVGIITDAVAQHLIFNQIRILSAVFVGCIVISLPYLIMRGLTNRICSKTHLK